jgi:hypothetical protein
MSVISRRLGVVVLLAGLAGLGAGCDLGSLAYFLMPESREPAKLKKLASTDAKKVPKVVILTWAGVEMRPEFIHVDRRLSEMLAAQLVELTKDNDEKLTIIPSRKVEDYKNSHPDWRYKDLTEIGRHFDVDYVINLEIDAMSLYEPRSNNTLFRGRAQVSVSLIDVHHPDDTPARVPFTATYPSEARGPVSAGFDDNLETFRQAFLTHVAKSLSYYFSPYSKRQTYFTE